MSGKIIPRVWTSPRTAQTNRERATAYDRYTLKLASETNLLKSFIEARNRNTRFDKNYPWKTSILEFIKYNPQLQTYKSEQPEKYEKLLKSFKNLEEIEEQIDSNRDTIKQAAAMSHSLRFTTTVKNGGKKYRKHKSSKHKSSKHKSSKHKSRKHKSSKHKSSKHKSRK